MSDGFTPQDDQLMRLVAMTLAQQYGAKTNSKGQTTGVNPNGLQDFMQMLAEPKQAALLAGLMGSSGGFDPAAFKPVEKGVDEFEVPNNPLSPYMQLGPTSMEGIIAQGIASGAAPSEVVAELGFDEGTDQLKEAKKLAGELFAKHHDWQAEMSVVPGMVQGEDGQFHFAGGEGLEASGRKIIRRNMEDSEMAATFKALGLPSPFEEFGANDFLSDEGYGSMLAVEDAQPELDDIGRLMAMQQAKQGGRRRLETSVGANLPQPKPVIPSDRTPSRGNVDAGTAPVGGFLPDAQVPAYGTPEFDRWYSGDGRAARSPIEALAAPSRSVDGGLVDLVNSMRNRPSAEQSKLNAGYGGTTEMRDLVQRASRVQQATGGDKFRSGVEALKAQWRSQQAAAEGDTPFRRAMLARLGALG